jgi:hypothetical protein
MMKVKLIGTPSCRRYQKMRSSVIEEAGRLKLAIQVEEAGDLETLAQFNPLSLPHLYIEGKLIASQNPPTRQELKRALESREG